MVCLNHDYRTYQNTSRVYGNGLKGFGVKGLGTKTFGQGTKGFGCNESMMVMSGNGLPRWLKKVGNTVVSTARKSVPWIKTIMTQLATDHAKDVANFVADEIQHSNKDAYPQLSKIAADATRRTGSIAQSQLKKRNKDLKLTPAQSAASNIAESASEQLLKQMLSGRKAKNEGEGLKGYGRESNNVITY